MNLKWRLKLMFSVKPEQKRQIRDRRINRHEIFDDSTDPYFLFRQNWSIRKINSKFADKVAIKDLVKDVVKTPKTLFVFDKNGNIIEGKIPKSGKVILKQTRSAYSHTIKVMDVKDINKKSLSKFYKENYLRDRFEIAGWDEREYYDIKERFFAEEYLPFVPKSYDYKLYTFNNKTIFGLEDPNHANPNGIVGAKAWDDKGNPTYHPAGNVSALNKMDKELLALFKRMNKIAKEVEKRIGHFARVDFYYDKENDEIYLGEATLNPAFGLVFDNRKTPKQKRICSIDKNTKPAHNHVNEIPKEIIEDYIKNYLESQAK